MKLRHWAPALLGLCALVLAGGGFLHHQQRLDALHLQHRDDHPTQALRSEIAELQHSQALIRSELDALTQQLSRLNSERAQLSARLTSQQTQLTALQEAPEDPRWRTLSQRIEQLESRTAPAAKPAVTLRTSKPRPVPVRALPALPPALPELIGIELRGAERLLAVAPVGSRRLNEVRLLRAGDRFGAWTLKRLDRQHAAFTAPGHAEQTLALP